MRRSNRIDIHIGQAEEFLEDIWKNKRGRLIKNSFFFAAALGVLLNLVIETLGRFSTEGFSGGINFLINQPVVFLYNALLIFSTLVFASVFKRRLFAFTFISACWLAIGIANCVVLSQRMTPFTMKDLDNIKDGLAVSTKYFSALQIGGIFAGIVLGIALLALLFIKGKKKKPLKRMRNAIGVVLVSLLTLFASQFAISTSLVDTFFGNLAYAYRDNGVAYCFVNTWLNTGIKRPGNYSRDSVKRIFTKEELGDDGIMALEPNEMSKDSPNILFLQLESFIDPLSIATISLDKDPCPNFRKLLNDYSSGKLWVPACGAGTANVEFEVLTGLSAKFFGPGEYPYKSVLTEKTCESLAYDLKSLGYSTHAIHNHIALFYNRNTVFSNIGFDTFTSVEYMKDVEMTPRQWEKDNVLTECIVDALDSTDSRDMIYTISVQGHGKYPDKQILKNPKVKVVEAPSQELKWKYEYYVNQIYEMDEFVAELIKTLEERNEPTILAIYGDHIPAIEIREDEMMGGDLYTTQYVIWDNIGLKKKDENMYSYQLGSHMEELADLQVGTIFTYQQNHRNSETYHQDLKSLGYDMLYGKGYIYGGKNPFEPTELKMGVKDIVIERIVQIGGKYYIKGRNFNAHSKVTLDGKQLETIYLGENLLGLLESVDPEDGGRMKVSQIDEKNNEILSTSE